MLKPMDEVVTLAGFRGDDFTATRGAIYAAALAHGETEFIAAQYAFAAKRTDATATIGAAGLSAWLHGNHPAAILAA